MKQSYKSISLLIVAGVLVACNSNPSTFRGDRTTATIVVDGKKLTLNKNAITQQFNCKHFDGPKSGEFAFSIRRYKNKNTLGILIFPDSTYNFGELNRIGLDWKFNWTEGPHNYSLKIQADGNAYYFDPALADENEKMTASIDYICR